MSKCVRTIKSSGSVFTRRRMTLVTRHNLPCSISGRLGPRSGRRTWSGSTNTDSHNRLQIWSCGRCRRSVHHPGERPSPPTPWLAGSPSPCSWTTAAGCLWMKQKYDSFEGWPYFQERRQKVTEGQQWVQLILPSCHRVFLCLLLFPDQLTDSKNSSNRYEKRELKSIGFIEGVTVLDFSVWRDRAQSTSGKFRGARRVDGGLRRGQILRQRGLHFPNVQHTYLIQTQTRSQIIQKLMVRAVGLWHTHQILQQIFF